MTISICMTILVTIIDLVKVKQDGSHATTGSKASRLRSGLQVGCVLH
jgi:hypothetical protein